MKIFISRILVIVIAIAGVIILLKKGGTAGARAERQISPPLIINPADRPPLRPLTIAGKLENDSGPIPLKRMRSWGIGIREGFLLAVSASPNWRQPSVRVTLAQKVVAPLTLQIDYTIAEDIFKSIEASPARQKFDGVAVEVRTKGNEDGRFVLLTIDPLRSPDQRKWFSYNLTLPIGTTGIEFLIVGLPPNYNIFWDTCSISLPQLVVFPNPSATASPLPHP